MTKAQMKQEALRQIESAISWIKAETSTGHARDAYGEACQIILVLNACGLLTKEEAEKHRREAVNAFWTRAEELDAERRADEIKHLSQKAAKEAAALTR